MTSSEAFSIILSAHGDKRGADRDARLEAIASACRKAFPKAYVSIALVSDPAGMETALEQCPDGPVIITPLMFSNGFFYRERIAPVAAAAALLGRDVRLAQPLCEWDELADLILRQTGRKRPIQLVAHGSSRSSASRDSALALAARLEQAGAVSVNCAFLEEAPFAHEVFAALEGRVAAVGLFMGQGLHGDEDFNAALSQARKRPRPQFIVGEAPRLGGIICNRIRQMLEGV